MSQDCASFAQNFSRYGEKLIQLGTARRGHLQLRPNDPCPLGDGGEGWIRTSVRLRGQIYSLLPLTTRPPLQVQAGAPNGGAASVCQRVGLRRVAAARFARAPTLGHAAGYGEVCRRSLGSRAPATRQSPGLARLERV